MIKIEKLHKSYVTGSNSLHVLKGIDLHIEQGEMVSIMGASGSGKSTLASLLLRFYIDFPITRLLRPARFRAAQSGIGFKFFESAKKRNVCGAGPFRRLKAKGKAAEFSYDLIGGLVFLHHL